MTDREAFNKTRRVYYAAGRFDGLSTREAHSYAMTGASRLFPELHRQDLRSTYLRRKDRAAAGDIQAQVTAAKSRLRASNSSALEAGHAPLQITPERLAEEYQKTVCDCCQRPFQGDRHADHCHETGQFRGMLCRACNCAEGHLETAARARQLAAYMEKHERNAGSRS